MKSLIIFELLSVIIQVIKNSLQYMFRVSSCDIFMMSFANQQSLFRIISKYKRANVSDCVCYKSDHYNIIAISSWRRHLRNKRSRESWVCTHYYIRRHSSWRRLSKKLNISKNSKTFSKWNRNPFFVSLQKCINNKKQRNNENRKSNYPRPPT